MVATFKSHILSRDEKGFAGIPFKRLLLGAVIGGLAYTVGRFAIANFAIPLGVVVALLAVVLTAPRGGLPLALRLWLDVRGRLLLAAAHHPKGLAAEAARLFSLPVERMVLDGDNWFSTRHETTLDLAEWVTFASLGELDRDEGLVFLNTPLEADR